MLSIIKLTPLLYKYCMYFDRSLGSRCYSFMIKQLFFNRPVQNKFPKLKDGCVLSAYAFGTFILVYCQFNNVLKVYCETVQEEIIDDRTHEDSSWKQKCSLTEAISKTKDLVRRIKDEVGSPGIVVGVSVDGKTVLETGMGFADIENRVQCSRNTVMRIASISKSITMAAIAKLWQEGKIDLDKPVQEYVPSFPEKTFNNEKVVLTCRHLVSHLGGIRHYDKNVLKKNDEQEKTEASKDKNISQEKIASEKISSNKKKNGESRENQKEEKDEFALKEYYIKDKFYDVKSSLDLFKEDPLVHKPGTKFLYTTHGWTLLSVVVEAVTKESFPVYMCKLFKELGMTSTYLDLNDAIIYHRSRNYVKNKKGHIFNAPYVDNSYKWAGGGFLSTVGNLLRFGNIMLYSLQYRSQAPPQNSSKMEIKSKAREPLKIEENSDANLKKKPNDVFQPSIKDTTLRKEKSKKENSPDVKTKKVATSNVPVEESITLPSSVPGLPGFLRNDTVEMLWTPITNTAENNSYYGMGWAVSPQKQECAYCKDQSYFATHSGGAIGASSVLLIMPRKCPNGETKTCLWHNPPKGVIVTIMTNLQGVSLAKTALEIANTFSQVEL